MQWIRFLSAFHDTLKLDNHFNLRIFQSVQFPDNYNMHEYFLNFLYDTKAEIFSYKNVKEKNQKEESLGKHTHYRNLNSCTVSF